MIFDRCGTCIRDYFHINELCVAHALALEYKCSEQEQGALHFNLGNGQGFSVREVINFCEKVMIEGGCQVEIKHGERRGGEPVVLVADSTHAKAKLGWQPIFSDLEPIVQHACAWETKQIKED